jgi:hypothetical protein
MIHTRQYNGPTGKTMIHTPLPRKLKYWTTWTPHTPGVNSCVRAE